MTAAEHLGKPRVVIVGGGFAGVAAARELLRVDAEVLVIDRRNHHIFQPLLYQVATALLAPSDIAVPLRQLAHKQRNISVLMAEVTGVDLAAQIVHVQPPGLPARSVPFEYLIMAAGVRPCYFGRDEFAACAPSLKTLADAEAIRSRILAAYELAEQTESASERRRALSFVLVGAGPTGVELAASIAHMAQVTLRSEFRRIEPADTRIILLEAGPRVLATFNEALALKAVERLEALGVEVHTRSRVEQVDSQGVVVDGERIDASTVLWTAGVQASAVVGMLSAKTDRAGRVLVEPGLNLPGHARVLVVGDAASLMQDGQPVPGVAQAAIQQGGYAGRRIAAAIHGRAEPAPFRYFDRGNMAVVGKNFAVLERGRIRFSGLLIWMLWVFIHIAFLPQLQNRLRVQMQWLWSYFSGQRSSRLIPEPPVAR